MPDISFSIVNGCPLGGETTFTSATVELLLSGVVAALDINTGATLS